MKHLILTIALVFTSFFSFAQTEGITITVTIDQVKSDNGKVVMSLHSKDTFMKGAGIMNAESKIKDGKVTITFENVKPGEYAIMALHDENENDRMDFENNGMPKEDYGTSNNVMAFGPPKYDNAKFTAEDKNLELKLRF